MTIDFGKTASDYRRYRAGFPDAIFERLRDHEIGLDGQMVVDVGTGTGSLARGFASRGCRTVGLDVSSELLQQASELDQESGVSVQYFVARAEETTLAGDSMDVYAAGQCWHWFDRPAAALEARRVLRPGGAVAICHFDFLPLPGNVVEATEALVVQHNPGWKWSGGNGMYPWWATDLATAGFFAIETFSFDLDVSYSHEAWRGRTRASAGVAAALEEPAVQRFDQEHAEMLSRQFSSDPLTVPHRVWACLGWRRLDR